MCSFGAHSRRISLALVARWEPRSAAISFHSSAATFRPNKRRHKCVPTQRRWLSSHKLASFNSCPSGRRGRRHAEDAAHDPVLASGWRDLRCRDRYPHTGERQGLPGAVPLQRQAQPADLPPRTGAVFRIGTEEDSRSGRHSERLRHKSGNLCNF